MVTKKQVLAAAKKSAKAALVCSIEKWYSIAEEGGPSGQECALCARYASEDPGDEPRCSFCTVQKKGQRCFDTGSLFWTAHSVEGYRAMHQFLIHCYVEDYGKLPPDYYWTYE